MNYSWTQARSDSSGEETDRAEQVKDDAGTGRSYECTYCKRGFTNAQALGGHMNIHRKDRARSKQPATYSAYNHKSDDDDPVPKYSGQTAGETTSHYYAAFEAQRSYHAYLSQPRPNPTSRPPQRSQHWRGNEGLTLRMGSAFEDYRMNKEDDKEDDMDLELRLGHRS